MKRYVKISLEVTGLWKEDQKMFQKRSCKELAPDLHMLWRSRTRLSHMCEDLVLWTSRLNMPLSYSDMVECGFAKYVLLFTGPRRLQFCVVTRALVPNQATRTSNHIWRQRLHTKTPSTKVDWHFSRIHQLLPPGLCSCIPRKQC